MHALPIFTFIAISINYKCVRGVLLGQQFDPNNCDERCMIYFNEMCRLCRERIESEDAIQASNVKHSDKMKGIDLTPSELVDPIQASRANDNNERGDIEWTPGALEWMKKPNFEVGSTSKSQDTPSASEWIQKPNFEEGSTSKYQGTSTRHDEQRVNSQSATHSSSRSKNAVLKSILSTFKKALNL